MPCRPHRRCRRDRGPRRHLSCDDADVRQRDSSASLETEASMTNSIGLYLHVPEPAVRPGDTPDFSNFKIPHAGSVVRPAIDVETESIRDLAYSLIRVLNRNDEAV